MRPIPTCIRLIPLAPAPQYIVFQPVGGLDREEFLMLRGSAVLARLKPDVLRSVVAAAA